MTEGLRLLAIDDQKDNLTTLRAIVAESFPDALCMTAIDGQSGLETAVREHPDVILLDIVMPGMDGLEVCRRLKDREAVAHIPVIFVTATDSGRDSRVRALEAGGEAFLSKPIDALELTAQIRAMARLHAATDREMGEKHRLAAVVLDRTEALERELAERRAAESIMQARLRLMDVAVAQPMHELLVATLDEAEVLTGSRIGFYHFMDPDEVTISLQAWSTRTTGEMCASDPEYRHYPVTEAGVWVDCVRGRRAVIHNDVAALPHRKEVPPGHAVVSRELVVPVLRGDKVVAIIGVGNKDRDYDRNDVDVVTRLADLAWDIAERKRAHDEILRLNEELEERVSLRTAELEAANKEMEAFTYSVSHDLRAPLRAIDGFTQILLEQMDDRLTPEDRRIAAMISGNARKMGDLVDDLLKLSRLGRTAMSREVIDMHAVATSVFHEVTSPEMRARIDLRVDALPAALGDPGLIHQVWANLIANAVKYSGKRDRAVIEITGRAEDGLATYSVRDNGVGFDMQYADQLFGVFRRLHRMEDYEGTGVGLAIVARLVQRHGGSVWADAVEDQGATFHFRLPV